MRLEVASVVLALEILRRSSSSSCADPLSSSSSGARLLSRSFLLLPLSELVDEHYTVYFCLGDRLAAGRQMPRFCT